MVIQQKPLQVSGSDWEAIKSSLAAIANCTDEQTVIEIAQETMVQMEKMQNVCEVHNVYTLYEDCEGEPETAMLSFSRPQDWGSPQKWHYYYCKVEFELHEKTYINHCHLWQEVERDPIEAFQRVSSALFQVFIPGKTRELCDRSHLADEDFWLNEWGSMPPVFDAEEAEAAVYYEPGENMSEAELEEVQDSLGGGTLVALNAWRLYHSDGIYAADYDQPPVQEDFQLLFDLEDARGQFNGYLIGVNHQGEPTLTEYWASRGWRLERKDLMRLDGQ